MMKNVNLFGIIFLYGALCLSSCSKTGPVGPQGEQGQQGTTGEKGPAGPQGITGADGSTIYSDNGAPAADVGKNGDYYLDKGTGNLYGPKTDNEWGNPVSLKGQKGDKGATGATGSKGAKGDPGQDGKDGSQILSGASAPVASVGKAGDYYWNTSSYTLYGPKISSGWGTGVVLRGPKGDKGDPGTANVMYSDWSIFRFNPSHGLQDKELSVDQLTTEFIEKGGVVLGYMKGALGLQLGTIMSPLPFTDSYWGYTLFYTYKLNNITYYVDEITAGSGLEINMGFYVRYILIPAGVHIRKSSPTPDPKDYKAICEYYGIPE